MCTAPPLIYLVVLLYGRNCAFVLVRDSYCSLDSHTVTSSYYYGQRPSTAPGHASIYVPGPNSTEKLICGRHLWPEVDPVNRRYVIFEMHHTIENQSLSLAHGMVTSYQLAKVLQMNILDMVPHVRNVFKGAAPLVI